MAETRDDDAASDAGPGRDYPTIDLETAINRAQQVYKNDKKNAVSPDVLADHWGYKPKSSGLGLTASALKKFGLLTKAEVGKVKLTDLALNIILDDEGSAERTAAIQRAAVMPELYGVLWKKYGSEPPSDTSFKKMLVMEMGFHDKIAVDVINKYRKTITFAGLNQPDLPAKPPSAEAGPAGVSARRDGAGQTQTRHPKQPGAREFRLTLGHGEALISVPPGTTPDDVDLLIQTLTLWKPRMVTKEGE